MVQVSQGEELERLRKRAERERRARQSAELLAEKGTREIYERQRQSNLLHAIADAANAATTVESAIQVALDQVGAYTEWPVGHAFLVEDRPAGPVLVPANLWHLASGDNFLEFKRITEAISFTLGEGLPGRVLKNRNFVWIAEIGLEANFPRAAVAQACGLRSGFAFPVLVGESVVAVLEFFSREPSEPDEVWLKIVSQIGVQLGRIFERHRAKQALLAVNERLQGEIRSRELAQQELEKTHAKLLVASREAGMAEVATGVLHNVGNVLNSVNVSATLVGDAIKKSRVANLPKAMTLFRDHAEDLAAYLSSDPKGKQLPAYLEQLGRHLVEEQLTLGQELEQLRTNIEHIRDIVAMQQNYAKVSGVTEKVKVSELVEDSLRLHAGALARHSVEVIKEYDPHAGEIIVEKHKVLQILVNLVSNAKYACSDSGRLDRRMTLRVARGRDRVRISVADNGIGIPSENLNRIFNHGFTTRQTGHGFGLHSGALAAKEMGGSLRVESEGPGRGAVFTLELPQHPPKAPHERRN